MVESDKTWLRFMSRVRVRPGGIAGGKLVHYVADSVALFHGCVGYIVGKKGNLWTVAFESALYHLPVEAGFTEDQIEPSVEAVAVAPCSPAPVYDDPENCSCHRVPWTECPHRKRIEAAIDPRVV